MQEVLTTDTLVKPAKEKLEFTPQSRYQISRETAVQWRRNWEADLAEGKIASEIRSWRIDAAELEEILGIPGTSYVRVYFGKAERGGQEKMILVAVDKNSVDMVHGEDALFFDFTSPCPTACALANEAWW